MASETLPGSTHCHKTKRIYIQELGEGNSLDIRLRQNFIIHNRVTHNPINWFVCEKARWMMGEHLGSDDQIMSTGSNGSYVDSKRYCTRYAPDRDQLLIAERGRMDEGAWICLPKNLPRAYFALEILFQLFDINGYD